MGCYFLGCFGFSSKRRRKKHANATTVRVLPQQYNLRHGSYEPLDSVSLKLDIEQEGPLVADSSEKSKKDKESLPSSSLKHKIRKRVRFNLNVQTYEPIPSEETSNDLWESYEERDIKANTSKETKEQTGSCSIVKWGSYPSNYRYRRYFEEEEEAEEELLYDKVDLDDDDDDDDNEYEDEENNEDYDDEYDDHINTGVDRSQYVKSVLNPIENLSQWKAVKARGVSPSLKSQRKENLAAEDCQQSSNNSTFSSVKLMQEGAVDASLSNWLLPSQSNSAPTFNVSGKRDVGFSLCKNSSLFEETKSGKCKEDIPVSDITNYSGLQ